MIKQSAWALESELTDSFLLMFSRLGSYLTNEV